MLLVELALCAVVLGDTPAASGVEADIAQVRGAIDRGLPYLEKGGREWLDQRKCVSCHHGQFMLWTLREGQRRGFTAVEPAQVEALTQRTLTLFLADRNKYEQEKKGHVESMNLLLGYGSPAGADANTRASLDVLASLVRNNQQADGQWKYAGQVQDRPGAEADETTTGWAILAMESGLQDEAAVKSREQAVAWLAKAPVGEGNESRVVRLLLALQAGDAEQTKTLADELIARQNADGGWSWSKKRGSDAFATGQSLYALGRAGRASEPAVAKARQHLGSTQRDDGSWLAPTKKASGSDAIAIYWGSAWAVLGLMETLP